MTLRITSLFSFFVPLCTFKKAAGRIRLRNPLRYYFSANKIENSVILPDSIAIYTLLCCIGLLNVRVRSKYGILLLISLLSDNLCNIYGNIASALCGKRLVAATLELSAVWCKGLLRVRVNE
jgi:hypothetical protein